MLILNGEEMRSAASFSEMITAVESAMVLYEQKSFHMPPRLHAEFGENVLLLMPCFTKDLAGVKLVSVTPGNALLKLPVIQGTMILNHVQTGVPLALLNGSVLTALRTGAAGAVSIRHLARPQAATLGVIGAGVQGIHQALFACSERPFNKVLVYDPDPAKVAEFTATFQITFADVPVSPTNSNSELTAHADVIITATPSLEPVLPDREDLLRGKHVVGIGSFRPDMHEFPASLYRLADRIFIDTDQALHESGDLLEPLRQGWLHPSQILTLGKLILDRERCQPRCATTVFKSVGMALFDLVAAALIYHNAQEKGLGTEVEL